MKESQDFKELSRRRTLAEIRITSEISKKVGAPQSQQPPPVNDKCIPTTRQLHNRFHHATQDVNKTSMGMMLVGIMLTLTSIVLVSLCFVTTVDSYDLALNQTDHLNLNTNLGGGGMLWNRYTDRPPRIIANHLRRQHMERLYDGGTTHM